AASDEFAASLSVMRSTSRLTSKSRAISSRLVTASRARSRATAERRLATRLTARKAISAIQFCGSTIVSVPMGGRKKKLSVNTEITDVVSATHKRAPAATNSTTTRKLNATVVAFDT